MYHNPTADKRQRLAEEEEKSGAAVPLDGPTRRRLLLGRAADDEVLSTMVGGNLLLDGNMRAHADTFLRFPAWEQGGSKQNAQKFHVLQYAASRICFRM